MTYIIDDVEYVETEDVAKIDDYVVSSEQIGIPRIYKVYHTTDTKLVLGKYSNGHTSLSYYKVLKPNK